VPAAETDLTVRPITGSGELNLFCRFPYVLNAELADDLAAGRRRPEWMWVALRGQRLVARVAWWGRAGESVPQVMDVFDVDDAGDAGDAGDADVAGGGAGPVEDGVQLLHTAMRHILPAGTRPPDYSCYLGAAWRDDLAEQSWVRTRMAALERVGADLFVERLRLEWRPPLTIPAASRRLTFRPVADRAELIGLMTLVLDGTLDAHSRDDLMRLPPARVAELQYDEEFARYPSPQEWWRVASLSDGEPVGFVIPARNDSGAIIAYIGVLQGHRGHGLIDDILAEGTRVLGEQDVPRIRASTDLANVPMARAFARAGYVTYQRQIDMRWP
jgi:hypothetical protein